MYQLTEEQVQAFLQGLFDLNAPIKMYLGTKEIFEKAKVKDKKEDKKESK